MRVCTWNIAGGHTLNGTGTEALKSNYDSENLSYFTHILKSINPDIIPLQEVHLREVDNYTQATSLAEKLAINTSPTLPYGKSIIEDGHQLSLAIMSKLPILGTEAIELPNPHLTTIRPDGSKWVTQDRKFYIAYLEFQSKKIRIINGHTTPLHYFDNANYMEPRFENIRQKMTEIILSDSECPTIIAADFNYPRIQELLPQVFSHGFVNTFDETTTPNKGQQDHVLISPHWQIQSYEVRRTDTDHYPCIVDLNLNN